MSDIVSPLLQWLNAHPELAGLVTFLISAGESVAILGTIVPGSIMMTALGTLAGAGVIPLWPTIFWAIVGAIVGDGISYWMGHYFKDRLPTIWPFRNYPGFLSTGKNFVLKYGAMSVFIGRFVGPVRAIVPLVAGMLGMKPLQFSIANVTSAIGWAPAYMLPGILLGAASLELPRDIAIHVILVLLLLILFSLLCLWFLYKFLQLINHKTNQLQSVIWSKTQGSRSYSFFSNLLKYHGSTQPPGQLKLAFYCIITTTVFLLICMSVGFLGPAKIYVNEIAFHFFRGIRHTALDSYVIIFTLLGQKDVVLPVFGSVFLGLLISNHKRAAYHILALGVLTALSVFCIKHLLQIPRPWGTFTTIETYSMPSGHTTFSTALFMGILILAMPSIPYRFVKRCIFFLTLILLFVIGFSRIYLGAHWLTDVLSAWLLSASILFAIYISYHRYLERPIKLTYLALFTLPYIVLYVLFLHQYAAILEKNHSLLHAKPVQISSTEWWNKVNVLPEYRTKLFGFPAQEINIAWEGSLNNIREALLKAGWIDPPARDWISTLHRIADVKSSQYLPLISPQYLDRNPDLVLARGDDKGLLVLRLWDSNLRTDKFTPIWVGMVGIAPRSYSWIFNSRPHEFTFKPALIIPTHINTNAQSNSWEYKIVQIHPFEKAPEKKENLIMIKSSNHF